MRSINHVLLSGVLLAPLLLTAMLAPAVSPAAETPDAVTIAAQLLDRLDAGDYAAAEAMFSEKMAAAVSAEKLKTVWESLPTQAGAAKGRGEAELQPQSDTRLVVIPLHFANVELAAKIAIDAHGKIEGFMIQPAEAPPAPAPPADANYQERDLSVGAGKHALPATLAIPTVTAPEAGFPAVVLVQGSGPHDRDESIGPNRPFLDIARGLAAQGVAVLRYDKRTKARPQDYANGGKLSIDTETTNDAVTAVDTLKAQPQIDGKRLYVLGHSQGGMMAPRIAAHAATAGTPVAGLILLAAPTRKLLDILIEQNQRMAVLDDGHTSDAESAALQKLRAQVQAVRAGDQVATEDSPLGQPTDYWRTTDAVDAVAEAQADALPMLILQGARDIQVVDADWQGWKEAFHDDPKVTFKLYPALNHLGIAGTGEGNLAEYAVPGHVDTQLIEDVAKWIQLH